MNCFGSFFAGIRQVKVFHQRDLYCLFGVKTRGFSQERSFATFMNYRCTLDIPFLRNLFISPTVNHGGF